jgi:hypothetical protein
MKASETLDILQSSWARKLSESWSVVFSSAGRQVFSNNLTSFFFVYLLWHDIGSSTRHHCYLLCNRYSFVLHARVPRCCQWKVDDELWKLQRGRFWGRPLDKLHREDDPNWKRRGRSAHEAELGSTSRQENPSWRKYCIPVFHGSRYSCSM